MGVNIILYRDGREEHPVWDWLRHAGDRRILSVLPAEAYDRKQIGHQIDDEFQYRPKDVAQFRDAMIAEFPENETRWRELAEILESGDWWIYCSY